MNKFVSTTIVLSFLLFSCCDCKQTDAVEQKRIVDSLVIAKLDSLSTERQITSLQAQYISIDSVKNELQKAFDAAVIRLDSLSGYNNELEEKISERNSEIDKLKKQIKSFLGKAKLTEEEKEKSESLIIKLNDKIDDLAKAISQYKQ
jgi:chromosome segregation ATPase